MECSERKLGVSLPLFTLVPEVFREERRQKKERERREEREKEERERSGERKPLAAGDANFTIILSINITRSINKQPVITYLSVNNSQSKYAKIFLQSGGTFCVRPIVLGTKCFSDQQNVKIHFLGSGTEKIRYNTTSLKSSVF